jgi:hypothetical protein
MAINSVSDSTSTPPTQTVMPTTTHKSGKKHKHASMTAPTALATTPKGTVGVNIDTSKVPETMKQESLTATKSSVSKYA